MARRPVASTALDPSGAESADRRSPTEPEGGERRRGPSEVGKHLLAGVGATVLGLAVVVATGGRLWLPRPAAVAVLVLGPVAWTLWFAGPRRQTGEPLTLHRLGPAVWIVLGLLFWGWELAAYLLGDAPLHPTFSRIVGPWFRSPPLKVLAVVAWLAWGRLLGRTVRGLSLEAPR